MDYKTSSFLIIIHSGEKKFELRNMTCQMILLLWYNV